MTDDILSQVRALCDEAGSLKATGMRALAQSLTLSRDAFRLIPIDTVLTRSVGSRVHSIATVTMTPAGWVDQFERRVDPRWVQREWEEGHWTLPQGGSDD